MTNMAKERRRSAKEPLGTVTNGDTSSSPTKCAVPNYGLKREGGNHYFGTQFETTHNILVLQIKYQHVCVFVGGLFLLFSCWLFTIIGNGIVYRKHLQHLPSEHYLQVRDDFSLYQTKAGKEGQVEYSEYIIRGQAIGNVQSEQKAAKNSLTTDEAANIQEALGSLRLALIMHQEGKEEKAGRLFEHAYALAPKHPEVLLRYGEYLEYSQRDVVLADQYYFQVS